MAEKTWYYQNKPRYEEAARLLGAAPGQKSGEGVLGGLKTTVNNATESLQGFADVLNGVNNPNLKPDLATTNRFRYQFANLYIATGVSAVGGALDGATGSIQSGLQSASSKIAEVCKPVSLFMGSTLGTLTQVMKDPIGSVFSLPNTIGMMLDQTNPNFKAKFDATYKKFQLDKIAEFPKNLFGSIFQIAQMIDKALAIPLSFVEDLYQGLMDIFEDINEFINDMFKLVQEFFMSMISSLLGEFAVVLEFLNQVTAFANQLGGIITIFAGANQFTGILNNVIGAANSINGILQNPLNLVTSFLPNEVTQGLYALQNPESLINQFLPPEIGNVFAQISQVTGFGFNGNMGQGLGSVLEGLRGGVITSILEGFATQFSILAPLFTAGNNPDPKSYEYQSEKVSTADGTEYDINPTTGGQYKTAKQAPKANYATTESSSGSSSGSTASPTTASLGGTSTSQPSRTTTGATNSVSPVTVGGGAGAGITSIFDLQAS